jgi:hypothetical protein
MPRRCATTPGRGRLVGVDVDHATRVCARCQQAKPRAAFSGPRGYCRPCHAAYVRERRKDPAILARQRASNAAWRNANRERTRAYDVHKRASNPGYWRAWDQDKRRSSKARRRSNERLGPADRALSAARRKAIKHDACYACGAPGEHDDHLFPLGKGGSDHWWNIGRLCAPCNRGKGTTCVTAFLLAGRRAG